MEEKLGVLVDAIKIVDRDSSKHLPVEDSVKDVVSHFEPMLTEEQKEKIDQEMDDYRVRKIKSEESKEFQRKLEEERYREMLEHFTRTETGKW